jgi:hypothetical protein
LQSNDIVPLDGLNEIKKKTLNYYLNYKHRYTNIENIYHLIKSLKALQNIPIFKLEKPSFDFTETKNITVLIQNGFGKEITLNNTMVHYKLEKDVVEKKPVDEESLNLEDPTEEPKEPAE